jgi:magnesium transporter
MAGPYGGYGGGMQRNRLYRAGVLEAEDFDPADISERIGEPDVVVWLDLESPDERELALLAEEFSLNALAVEDAAHEHQRPKVDHYSDHIFMSLYGVHLDVDTGELHTSELAVFAAHKWLITVRKTGAFDMAHVEAVWDSNADRAEHGVGFLLHGLLDHVVDGHFEAVQELDDAVEDVEARLFDDKPQPLAVQKRSFQMRKALVDLRRVSLPMREVLNTLMRRDLGIVDEAMAAYFQDVYDHVLRVTEWTESLRDLVTTIQDSNLQVQSNRLNEVMKKLTAYAAIFGAVAAITGFFGQNLPYPGFGNHTGLTIMAILLLASTLGLGVVFKRRDWL